MIWVLTAGFGDGHNSAAKSVAEALRQLSPDEEIIVSDFLADVHPMLLAVLQRSYRFIITRFPALWSMAYGLFAKPSLGSCAHLLPTIVAALEKKLFSDRPRVIVSTYPLYSGLLEYLKKRGVPVPAIVTVITDSITVHPSWIFAPSDALCVADEETLSSVEQLNVPSSIVHVTGFPVTLRYLQSVSRTVRETRVLYMPSTTVAHFGATLQSLIPFMAQGVRFTIQTGRHAASYYQVLRQFLDVHPDAPVEVIGWTDQIPSLLKTHDVLICKAGGAILHEALAAQIPAIIDYVVPGQEEGNAELLLKHQCGLRSHSPQETAAHLKCLLDNNLALAKSMRANMQPLSAPDAALRVAELALSFAR